MTPNLAQLLYPPYESPTPTSSVGAASLATLLEPRYQKVPFTARDEERRRLLSWADREGTAGPRALLCVGPGGQGKTRLAAEVAMELQAKGWLAGFVRRDAPAEDLRKALQAAASDALLVVDDAGRRVEQVVAVLQAAESRGSGRTALLLLERSHGEWWIELRDKLQGTRAALDAVTAVDTLRLDPLSKSACKDMFEAATAAYGSGASGALPHDDNALVLQIAALLGVSGDRDQLLQELLEREGSYWRELARARGLSGEPDALEAAVALATLARPSKEEASAFADIVFEQGQVDTAVAWLGDLYPGEDSSIGSLEPDMLGDALIAKQLAARPRLLGALLERANERVAGNVFDALARTGSTRPQVRELVSAALRTMPPRLWGPAVRGAPALDESFARVLAGAFESAPALPCGPILQAIPPETFCLRELAASAQSREVVELREKRRLAGKDVRGWRRWLRRTPSPVDPALASALNNLSVRLGELGRRKEGVRAVQEAVRIHRKLAEARPDDFLPDLAASLNNLSVDWGALGRRKKGLRAAQEAVEVHRKLAEVRPDACLPGLATSLNNLSISLGGLGRHEEGLRAAQEAVEIRRKLAEARPDAFLLDLVKSLSDLSHRLGMLGRHDEGLWAVQEAVEIRRKLAEASPDDFVMDLAKSLNELSNLLRKLKRREEAAAARREAVAMILSRAF